MYACLREDQKEEDDYQQKKYRMKRKKHHSHRNEKWLQNIKVIVFTIFFLSNFQEANAQLNSKERRDVTTAEQSHQSPNWC